MSLSHAEPGIAAPLTLLDTRVRMETPEGIDLILRPAGLLSRSLAFGIDLMIRGVLLGALFFLFGTLGDFGTGLFMLMLFVMTWGYMVLFEVLHQGRTPGKQIMGLRVIHDDGTPIGWSGSVLRNLLRFVDMLPFGYGVGALTCLQHPLFKRLGDLAAGTLVVYRDLPPQRLPLAEAAALPPPFPLLLEEQRAIQAFAERQGTLSTARARELAGILAQPLQLSASPDPHHPVQQLNGIARGLAGIS